MPEVGASVKVVFEVVDNHDKAVIQVKPNMVLKFDPKDKSAVDFVVRLVESSNVSMRVHSVIQSEKIKK